MNTWETINAQGIEKAKRSLSENKKVENIRHVFLEWLSETQGDANIKSDRDAIEVRIRRLDSQLATLGFTQPDELVQILGHHEGKIPAKKWEVAQLIGQAAAHFVATYLKDGTWKEVKVCGLDSYGAWSAFEEEMLVILERDSTMVEALKSVFESHVNLTVTAPESFVPKYLQEGHDVRKTFQEYVDDPCFDECFETRLDSVVWRNDYILSRLCRLIDPDFFLKASSRFGHPVFFDPSLGSDELSQTGVIAGLIAKAPTAFDQTGKFLQSGLVVGTLLSKASEYIRHRAGNGAIIPLPATPETEASLRTQAESASSAGTEILDALFSRGDAKQLAWAWLERLIREGQHRGYWSPGNRHEKGFATNALMILIVQLARRIEVKDIPVAFPKDDFWKPHIGPIASLAVIVFQENARTEVNEGKIRDVLMSGCPDFHLGSGGEIFGRPERPLGIIGANCLLNISEPGVFLTKIWNELRPYRERSWRVEPPGNTPPNPGMLLVLWGLFAIHWAPTEKKEPLLVAMQSILKDAWQTDAGFSIRREFWPDALEFFAREWARSRSRENNNIHTLLAELLLPHLQSEKGLMQMVVALKGGGIPLDVMEQAIAPFGEKIGDLAQQFLYTHQYKISEHVFNHAWIAQIREIAGCSTASVCDLGEAL